eukprot:CAMPEP_0174748258 /NCGR_PEP_ID=MMETSP1094-20130205/93009_1 /TAXON_ID=156173 /ORGANISM="Chrysochromulina brevifilum, Strain UTEX LB 985" /LENGTH=107 /DNA_ID=CAMNT_0015953255 /DNA_START=529 /DNA_END=852 /DNA_ORIENTATION=+
MNGMRLAPLVPLIRPQVQCETEKPPHSKKARMDEVPVLGRPTTRAGLCALGHAMLQAGGGPLNVGVAPSVSRLSTSSVCRYHTCQQSNSMHTTPAATLGCQRYAAGL